MIRSDLYDTCLGGRLPYGRSVRGFTLMELMIVVAIVAVLMAIAYPSYQSQMQKSRRAEAKADMLEYTQSAERYYTANNTYKGFTLPADYSPRGRAADSAFYKLSIVPAPTTFTITAEPIGRQKSDECGTLTIDQANRKTHSPSATYSQCW